METELTQTQQDQRAFDAMREDLIKAGKSGKYAVVSGGQLVGFYDSETDAYADALQKFGPRGSFVIDQVGLKTRESVSLAWDLGLMLVT